MGEMQKTVTVIDDGCAMLFVTAQYELSRLKKWHRLKEADFSGIHNHSIVCVFSGSGGIYQILKDKSPEEAFPDRFKLLKATNDKETGRSALFVMNISDDEAKKLISIRNALWE